MKIQTKITLLFVLVTASIIFILGSAVYFFVSRFSYQDFYKRLEIRAIVAARAVLSTDTTNNLAYHEIRRQHLERLPGEQEYFLPIEDGRIRLRSSDSLRLPGAFYRQVLTQGIAQYSTRQVIYAGVLYKGVSPGHIVIVSAENQYGKEQLQRLQSVLIGGMIIGVLVVAATGIFFSNRILKPVRAITQRVKDIGASNLNQRLDASGADEISELAQTFNNMLDRLETAFETQTNFVGNASHELSTPLTVIIGESEYALVKTRTEEQYQHSLTTILSEAERLRHITTSLLNLAQTGMKGNREVWERVRVDELLLSVKSTVDKIIPASKVNLDYSLLPDDARKLLVSGNPQLLQLAISNIILNACKYSGNNDVVVGLAATNAQVVIQVIDKGIGIPAKELSHVFDPFFRASNTWKIKGFGVGLPLSRNILRLHGGDITVVSEENKGTAVQVLIPIAG